MRLPGRPPALAFSMIEMVVTLVLVMLLIAASALYFGGVFDDARGAMVVAGLHRIRDEVDRYLLVPGRTIPARLDTLRLRREQLDDPWGRPFVIEQTPPRVISGGPDRTFDTPPGSPDVFGDDVALELRPPRPLPPRRIAPPVEVATVPMETCPSGPPPEPPSPAPAATPSFAEPPPAIVTIVPDLTLIPRPPRIPSGPAAGGAPPLATTDKYCLKCHAPAQDEGHGGGGGHHDHDHCCPGQTGLSPTAGAARPPPTPSTGGGGLVGSPVLVRRH